MGPTGGAAVAAGDERGGEKLEGDFFAIVSGRSGSMNSGGLTWFDVFVKKM